MKTEQLFPPCERPDCPEHGTKHHHILPKQQELLEANEKYIALIGGYGSAKTLGGSVMGHLLSLGVPGNIGIVCRRSLPKLHDSTERIFLEILERSKINFRAREMRDSWPHRIIYPNGSEVHFRETKDIGRFLGPEYGWFMIDEAQEEPQKTYTDLKGRLRLPRAAKYLRGLIMTNPPSNQHWIAKEFPNEGSWTKTITIKDQKTITESYRMIRSTTYDNPFLDPAYVAGLLQSHTPGEVKRIVEGQYGFVQEGKPVYPMFDYLKHVADPQTFRMTVYRVWDFGFHCPATMWGQIFRCKHQALHATVLHEAMGQDTESEPYAMRVLEETRQMFPNHPLTLVLDGGDAAGAQVNEKGPGPIIRLARPRNQGGFNLNFKFKKFIDIDPGLDLVRRLLRTKCKCGYYLLVIHRRCRNMIEALAGGYHYPQEKPGREAKPKPVKDGYYDNIADTLRYFLMLFYLPMEQGLDQNLLDAFDLGGMAESSPWSWMETGRFTH